MDKRFQWFFALTALSALVLPFAAQAQSMRWPTTTSFRGQPEFEFNRTEVMKDAETSKVAGRGRAVSGEVLAPSIGTLIQRSLTNPFDSESGEVALRGDIPQISLDIQIPDLPDLTVEDRLNLDEFEAFLQSLLRTAPEQFAADFSDYDFSKELNKVVISSMMTSPDPYVVINGRRFREGDRFLLPVRAQDNTGRIEQMIDDQLPNPRSVTEGTYQKFVQMRDEAIADYKRRREEALRASANGNVHNVSVTVKRILHRQVLVAVEGKEYTLRLGVAL